MKKLWEKYTSVSLIKRIACGVILGVILGILLPKLQVISYLGTIFVGALKSVAPILVFFLVMSALCNSKQVQKGVIGSVVFLYLLTTVLAAVVAVIGSMLFPIKIALSDVSSSTSAPSGIGEVLISLFESIVQNPVSALAQSNYIGILFWACVFGCFLKVSSDGTKRMLTDISEMLSAVVGVIINLAPFGLIGLVFASVSTSGVGIFVDYGKLILLLLGCMFFCTFVTNPLIVFILLRRNPYPLVFRCLKESAITAFFTRSSAANIPINMKACEKLGLDENTYSVTIPLGATINMDGAAITITVMTLATCNTLGISVDFPMALILSLLSSLAASGSSGVAGGSLLLIPMACSIFGIPDSISMQVVAVGFIIGVIQDSAETALNSSCDLLFTATAEFYHRRKIGKDFDF